MIRTTRRNFLQTSLATSALSLAGRAGLWDPDRAGSRRETQPRVTLHAVVIDRRFASSVTFGRELARAGVSSRTIDGDITDLWYRELGPLWKHTPAAVAGLTAYGPLFCFEQLGRDHGLRIVFRGEHRPSPGGGIEHRLSGHGTIPQQAVCPEFEQNWEQRIASIVRSYRSGWFPSTHVSLTTPAASPAPIDTESLFSWIVARPPRR